MKSDHPRDITIWCEQSEERVLESIDTILDKAGINNPKAKKLLTDATKILKELDELKAEAESKL